MKEQTSYEQTYILCRVLLDTRHNKNIRLIWYLICKKDAAKFVSVWQKILMWNRLTFKIRNIRCILFMYVWNCSYYKLKRCSKKEFGKQCRYVKFKGTMTNWPVQNQHIERQKTRRSPWRNRHLEKKTIFVFLGS